MKKYILASLALSICLLIFGILYLTNSFGSIIGHDGTSGPGNGDAGTIYCYIKYGQNKYITDATVSLYETTPDNITDASLLKIPGNPVIGVNAKLNHWPALYKFENVPYGFYKIVAERNGTTWVMLERLEPSTDRSIMGCIADDPYLMVPESIDLVNGVIYGWVRDPNTADYLPGMTITLLKQNGDGVTYDTVADVKNNPVRSRSDPYTGFYSFENVPPGSYVIKTEWNGHVVKSRPLWMNGTEERGAMFNLTAL